MKKSREELEKELAEATAKLEQYQHKSQRLENRMKLQLKQPNKVHINQNAASKQNYIALCH